MSTPVAGGSLFRFGIWGIDPAGHRWIVTEMWYADTNLTTTQVSNVSGSICGWLTHPFGVGTGYDIYTGSGWVIKKLWPGSFAGRGLLGSFTVPRGPTLNVNAPEAAYRLQRVGASGAAGPPGRMAYPILTDSFYLDLPRRRHVDAAELQQALDDGWASRPLDYGLPYGHLRPVIYHRGLHAVTNVTSYRVLANPLRIWERWRTYPTAPHVPAADDYWHPPP